LTFTKSKYRRRAEAPVIPRDTEKGGGPLPLQEGGEEVGSKGRSGAGASEAKEAAKEADRRRKTVQDAVALAIQVLENPDATVRSARAILFGDNSKRWASASFLLGRSLVAGAAGMT